MGNTKPVYINMTLCKISPVRCLFLGSGDIRNILYLIHTSPTVTEWEFDLVDSNPSVVARNYLFLKILNDETVSIDVLWNIWYDFVINKSVYSYLQNLIEQSSIDNLEVIHEVSRPAIAKVFEEWLTLCKSIIKEKACKQRHNHLLYCFERICRTTFDKYNKSICESIASILVNENQTMIEEAKKEIKRYTEDGTTEITKDQDYVNITMLQSSTGAYTGHYGMCPYQSYIPFETIEEQQEFRVVTAQNSNPLVTYCKYRLEQWVKTYRQRRQSIKMHFWHGDALSLSLFHMPFIEFDLIHTSNLCDHIGMLNLLVTCITLLRNQPWSQILTQSMMWRTKFARFIDYIAQLFHDIEISWFPSLFGLICECTRSVGLEQNNKTSITMGKTNLIDSFEYQIWRLATNIHLEPHLRLDGTEKNILQVFDKLAERCFYTHLTKPEAYEGIGHSTTFTYYLLLRQYCLRCCVHPTESFEYLFQRTCDRFRAYATDLRSLRDFFTNNDNVYMYTSKDHNSTIESTFLLSQIQTPVLQIIIIECEEEMMHTILNAMRTDTFKETTKTSVMGNKISYDLCTGIIISTTNSKRPIKFHLIDNFVFKLAARYVRDKSISPEFYTNLAHDAEIQFLLPTSFSPLFQTAWLIDAHTWFPFAKFRLIDSITIFSKSASKALAVRDVVSLCYADISDRKVYYSNVHKNQSSVQIINAYETSSSFHVILKIRTQVSSWTHTQNLIFSGHMLILSIKFSQTEICHLHLAFACSLDLPQSKFQPNIKNGTFNIVLAKNTAELLSLTTFIRESATVLFDSTTAKRWPPPRLASGRLLDIGLNFPAPSVVGNYDSETMIVFEALTNMFTRPEFQLLQRQSGDYLQRDADFDLRESLRQMYLQAFCARQRMVLYSTKMGRPHSTTDIRTYGDILFLYEGVYNYCGRPILAVSYLDMIEIKDADVNDVTQYIKNLIVTELNIYASTMAQTRSVPQSLPSDFNVLEIKASKEELDLMRHFLLRNRAKTKGTHRANLRSPWHASFVEPILSDARSLLLSTKLTRENGINLENDARTFFQCQVCKEMPSDPSKPWSKCGQCKKVSYCSKKCQVQDWPNHKKSCKQ
jgi:hypothetical protein